MELSKYVFWISYFISCGFYDTFAETYSVEFFNAKGISILTEFLEALLFFGKDLNRIKYSLSFSFIN